MSIDINNIGPQRPDNPRSQGAKPGAVDTQNDASRKKAEAEQQGSGDNVSLSSEAQALTRIEAEIKSLPDVDQAKVDEVRARLENGSYAIDSQKLAQKMLDLEG